MFRTLLRMIDDPRNDIFVHMNVKNKEYDEAEIEKYVHYSRLRHVERTSVNWGGYSLINAELLLLKASTSEENYQRYHLLSGADLPIKTQDEIINFLPNIKKMNS